MQIRDLIPWGRERQPAPRSETGEEAPLASLQRDLNRAFEDFWSRLDRPFGAPNGVLAVGHPRTDISETDDEVEISVELPGLDDKDIEVNLTDDFLTVRGERKAEREEKKRGYYLSERSYGAVHRMIPLPPGVDTDKADARFKKGVLTVSLPKTPEAKAKVKRIAVKAG